VADDVETGVSTARRAPAVVRPALAGYAALIRLIDAIGWPWIRRGVGALYFAVIIAVVVKYGVPTGRQSLAYIIVAGLAITCLGRGWRRMLQVLIDWLPFTLLLVTYDQSRGLADTVGMPLHEHDAARVESWLFAGTNPTVWMQQHFYNASTVHWYDALATLIYTSHFIVTPVLAAILWLRDRRIWLRYVSRVILLAFAGLVTYVLFPEAPPWMASQDGYIGAVHRLSARGWEYLHAGFANKLLAHAQEGGSNPVAAMPSLHFAFACLAALFIANRFASRWRYLMVLYPIGMGLTLVYTGEHYVIDLIFGLQYAIAAHVALLHWERWWVERRARVAEADPIGAADAPEEEMTPAAASLMSEM
jgi:hypothetical protein